MLLVLQCCEVWDGNLAKELVKMKSTHFVLCKIHIYYLFRYVFFIISITLLIFLYIVSYRIVANVVPELRPKGMGLGADKMALQKQNGKAQKEEKELRMEKGTFIKVIAGKQSHAYGQIEGFDEDVGRLIVKMALSGNIVSINECTVQAVTKEEFLKNSKVLSK